MKRFNYKRIGRVIIVTALASTLLGISKYEQRETFEVFANVENKQAGKEIGDIEKVDVKKIRKKQVKVFHPIDFTELWALNKDVYAYIYISNTNVDYPILQHESDNAYYLDNNIDGSPGYPGCIYTEKENAKDFTDNNTVMYGHNMKTGAMFHSLLEYKDKTFFNENKYVYIYTPDKILQYEIFAAYVFDNRHLLLTFDFDDKEVFDEYLQNVMSKTDGNIRQDIALTGEDKIITMATCNGNPDERFLLQAVLKKEIKCNYKTETTIEVDVNEEYDISGMKD